MRSPKSSTTFKREFLKKWLLALQLCKSHHKNDVVERQNTIKLSAEIAMASARNGATCWSRALITKHSSSSFHQISPPPRHHHNSKKKRTVRMTCKKILKRSHHRRRRRCNGVAAAAAVVRRKTEVLKKLVPGGELIGDEVALIRETLDYMMSLRAQVDVMRSLARASEESRRHVPSYDRDM